MYVRLESLMYLKDNGIIEKTEKSRVDACKSVLLLYTGNAVFRQRSSSRPAGPPSVAPARLRNSLLTWQADNVESLPVAASPSFIIAR